MCRRIRRPSGQALIEFALLLPFLFVLIAAVVDFGTFMLAWITVVGASRNGAQYAIRGGATMGAPAPPTYAEVLQIITKDVSFLMNRDSLQVKVCTINATDPADVPDVSCEGSGGPDTIPPDPEPDWYVLNTVDVTYTYQPLISFGINFPLTKIHRRAVMRMLQ